MQLSPRRYVLPSKSFKLYCYRTDRALTQAKEGKYEQNDDHEADQINYAVHSAISPNACPSRARLSRERENASGVRRFLGCRYAESISRRRYGNWLEKVPLETRGLSQFEGRAENGQ